jgi:hypothetical protein
LYGKINKYNRLGNLLYVREYQLIKRLEFVGDRTSYIVLRCRWCDIIVLNVHELFDDSNDGICEESENVFCHFPKRHMKILFEDFSTKLGTEDVFKPKIGNGTLPNNTNDNGVRDANFAKQKSSC